MNSDRLQNKLSDYNNALLLLPDKILQALLKMTNYHNIAAVVKATARRISWCQAPQDLFKYFLIAGRV